MRTPLLFLWSLCLLPAWLSGQTELRDRYVEQYSLLAVSEMERTGIPASIKLAQAILESRYGTSGLALESNNHFGIKCHKDWKGEGVYKVDDETNGWGRPIPSCFRAYNSAEESFIAHSEFLQSYRRYEDLFELDPDDYKGWAKGLKRAGYATSRSYHRDLINLIESLDLDQYDRMSSQQLLARMSKRERDRQRRRIDDWQEERPAIEPVAVLVNNDVKYLVTDNGESVNALAQRAGLPVRTLIRYNEHLEDAEMLMRGGTKVYVQPKRRSYRGRDKWHVVLPGERMFEIAQQYGIDLDKLYDRNRLQRSHEPMAGARLKLRGWKVKDAPDAAPRNYETLADRYRYSPVPESAQLAAAQKDTLTKKPVVRRIPNAPVDPFGGPAPLPKTDNPVAGELEFEVEPGAGPGQPVPGGSAVFHTVELGDSLERLAKTYEVSVDLLRKWNNLQEATPLRPGTRLRVR